jgi:hypothetical protein
MQAHEGTLKGNNNLTSLDKLIELVQVAILKSRNITRTHLTPSVDLLTIGISAERPSAVCLLPAN